MTVEDVGGVASVRDAIQDTTVGAEGQATFSTRARLFSAASIEVGRGVANARNTVLGLETSVASRGSITTGGVVLGAASWLFVGQPERS